MKSKQNFSTEQNLNQLLQNSDYKKPNLKRKSVALQYEDEIKQNYDTKKNCQEIFSKIIEMRSQKDAPVDTMGIHVQADTKSNKNDRDFQYLLGALISPQTKDQTTYLCMNRLKEYGCTAEKLAETEENKIKEMIFEANFNATKAKNIKKCAQMIMEDYHGKVPDTFEEIIKFPGVGPKIGYLYLSIAHNKTLGMAVDVHVHRISNRLKWVNTKTPEETRLQLEKMFDQDQWFTVNEILVGFGQQICLPQNPKCIQCKIADICPEGKTNIKKFKNIKK